MSTYRFHVGDFECMTINDGHFTADATIFFGDVPDEILNPVLERSKLPRDAIPSWFNPLHINNGEQKILIDTGAGSGAGVGDNENSGKLIENLQAAGISPEDIDVVIITHAHGDHINGNTNEAGEAIFPNATYKINQKEWDYWTSDEVLSSDNPRVPAVRKHLLRIADRFEQFGDEDEIVTGIRSVPAYGHTPGHTALLIQSGDEKLLNIADAFLDPLHAQHPEWSPQFDMNTELSPETRKQILKRCVDESLIMYAYHFPLPSLGTVLPNGSTWDWRPLQT